MNDLTNINVLDSIHEDWVAFFRRKNKESPLEYPNLKIFTAKMLKDVMQKEDHLPS